LCSDFVALQRSRERHDFLSCCQRCNELGLIVEGFQGLCPSVAVNSLNKVGLSIRAYGKKKNYVGRVEINHAGLAAFTGPRGKKCIANLSWEKLFAQLSLRQTRNGH